MTPSSIVPRSRSDRRAGCVALFVCLLLVGFFEGAASASPLCDRSGRPVFGDVDASGAVDQDDVDRVVAHYGQPPFSTRCPACDVNGDLRTDFVDRNLVADACTLLGCALVDCSFLCTTGTVLAAPDRHDYDEYGAAIDVDGDRVAIGAPGRLQAGDSSFSPSGAVFVYRRDGSAWLLEQEVTSASPGAGSAFGATLALEDDVLVVGTRGDTGFGSGFVVFERSGTTWSEQLFVDLPGTAGGAVDLDGGRLIVGATGNGAETRVYIRNAAGDFVQELAGIVEPATASVASFGTAVGVSGNRLVIGSGSDEAFVYVRGASSWIREATLERPATTFNDRADNVDIEGDTIAIAGGSTDGVDVFERVGGLWTFDRTLVPPTGGFNKSIELTPSYLILLQQDEGAGGRPTVYFYDRSDWSLAGEAELPVGNFGGLGDRDALGGRGGYFVAGTDGSFSSGDRSGRATFAACGADPDDDAVPLPLDNCPDDANADQIDTDDDGDGNACDDDDDDDLRTDATDNCPLAPNYWQFDSDADGVGNACDNCFALPNASQLDADSDGIGDACDLCPGHPDPLQIDFDADGLGDACDPDQDGDGLPNASDPDRDGDGITDAFDTCPSIPASQQDSDGDGLGDACDPDVPEVDVRDLIVDLGGQLDNVSVYRWLDCPECGEDQASSSSVVGLDPYVQSVGQCVIAANETAGSSTEPPIFVAFAPYFASGTACCSWASRVVSDFISFEPGRNEDCRNGCTPNACGGTTSCFWNDGDPDLPACCFEGGDTYFAAWGSQAGVEPTFLRDGDSIPDQCDNCPDHANDDQVDTDGDGRGDFCDWVATRATACGDTDGDGCDDCSSGLFNPAVDGSEAGSPVTCSPVPEPGFGAGLGLGVLALAIRRLRGRGRGRGPGRGRGRGRGAVRA